MKDKTFKWTAGLEMSYLIVAFAACFYWEGDIALKILLMLIFLLLMSQRNKPDMLLERIKEENQRLYKLQTFCVGQLYVLRMALDIDEGHEQQYLTEWASKMHCELKAAERAFDEALTQSREWNEFVDPVTPSVSLFIDWFFMALQIGAAAIIGWGVVWVLENYWANFSL